MLKAPQHNNTWAAAVGTCGLVQLCPGHQAVLYHASQRHMRTVPHGHVLLPCTAYGRVVALQSKQAITYVQHVCIDWLPLIRARGITKDTWCQSMCTDWVS